MSDKITNTVIICRSVEETHELTAQILKKLCGEFLVGADMVPSTSARGGAIIGLTGTLGAGKTEFVRGAAKVIGAEEDVSSPSYTLQNIYKSHQHPINTIYHWDLYRLSTGVDVNELSEGKRDAKSVTFIEWVEKFPEIENILDIKIEIEIIDDNTRQFTIRKL